MLDTTSRYEFESFTVGGVQISVVNREQALDSFFRFVSGRGGGFITVTSGHGIVEAQDDARLRSIFNSARMALTDGIPILWVGKLKNAAVERFTGTEFFLNVMSDARASHVRHYFYGGQPETTALVVARAKELLGADAVVGSYCPPMRPAGAPEDSAILDQIAATRPDVIWVGLNTPKQEYWMDNYRSRFPDTIFVGVGAAFDFFAGTKRRAPKFVQTVGFEWLFRLLQEPKRLWRRYSRVVPRMLQILFVEAIRR